MVCAVAQSLLPDWVPSYGLRWAQFQNWGSHHGFAGGLEDSMIQTLGRWQSARPSSNMSEPQRSDWPPCRPRWHLPQRHEPWSFNLSLCLSLLQYVVRYTPCRSDGRPVAYRAWSLGGILCTTIKSGGFLGGYGPV